MALSVYQERSSPPGMFSKTISTLTITQVTDKSGVGTSYRSNRDGYHVTYLQTNWFTE